MKKARIKTIDEAKKALKVKDISELTPEHAPDFIQLMNRMDKDVALKILDICPDLIQITPEVITAFERLGTEALKHCSKNDEAVFAAYQAVIDECKKELSKGKLSSRKKKKMLSMMIEVADKMAEMNKEHKKMVKAIHDKASNCGLVALGAVVAIVGMVVFGPRDPQK